MSVHDTQFYPAVKKLLGIPENEPIFVFRAQDRFAGSAVTAYIHAAGSSAGLEWERRARDDLAEFQEWQSKNPARVRTPD